MTDKIRIGIHMDGGLIQDIWTEKPIPGLEITIFDYDIEGADKDCISLVDRGPGIAEEEAVITVYDFSNDGNNKPIPAYRNHTDG